MQSKHATGGTIESHQRQWSNNKQVAGADLDRCLESLHAYPPAAPHQVVVVDNASQDPGLAAVRERYGRCL